MTLLDDVVAILAHEGVDQALVGASALAAHGVSRSTLDQDLLVVERRTLEPTFWAPLGRDTAVDARRGDADDPLAGVVRITRHGERVVDIVVGRDAWQREVLSRAQMLAGLGVRVVEPADLILLKLYAGGSQDRWDIEQLLALDSAGAITAAVDTRAGALPQASRDLWAQLRPHP